MISSWYLHEITEYKKNPIFISFFALLLILNHDFVLIRTCKILKRVDLPCERKPVSWQYCWYKSTILEAITVLTTFGISIFSPFDNFSVFVPYATSCTKFGLLIKSRKWSTLLGSSLARVMASICGTGLPTPTLAACLLASSIAQMLTPGISSWSCALE